METVLLHKTGTHPRSCIHTVLSHPAEKITTRPPVMEFHHAVTLIFVLATAAPAIVQSNHLIVASHPKQHQQQLHAYLDNPVVHIVSQGMELALKHCQQQFQHEPWNCPAKDFIAKQQQQQQHMDRETAFVQSITVAAIAYTMTKNCSNGGGAKKENDKFCECAFRDKNTVEEVYDCFTSIEGAEREMTQILGKLSKTNQAARDPQAVMLLQNSRAGLFSVINAVQKTCRCHGFSGSCSISTCWMALDKFSKIAADLKSLYAFAAPLDLQNDMRLEHLELIERQLVYLEDSPNYCSSSSGKRLHNDWESVRGRSCATSQSTDQEMSACKELCSTCGLRLRWKEVMSKRSCNCKFNWCCNVTCDVCEETIKEFYCY